MRTKLAALSALLGISVICAASDKNKLDGTISAGSEASTVTRILIALIATLISLHAHAQELSARDKVDIYGSCYPACQKTQRAIPQNEPLLDTPFILDAYCSCTCARMMFKLRDKEQVVGIARAQKQGRMQQYLRTDPSFSALQTQSAAVCIRAILGN